MKKLILALAAACLITSTPAGATPTPDRAALADQSCGQQEEMARTIMRGRQLGMPMSTLMALTTKHLSPYPTTLALFRTIISMAYDVTAYQTEENQERAQTDFAALIAKTCYEAYSK